MGFETSYDGPEECLEGLLMMMRRKLTSSILTRGCDTYNGSSWRFESHLIIATIGHRRVNLSLRSSKSSPPLFLSLNKNSFQVVNRGKLGKLNSIRKTVAE